MAVQVESGFRFIFLGFCSSFVLVGGCLILRMKEEGLKDVYRKRDRE